ncbi:MAG: S41 family peptidase [Planctomycetota bacterium]|jgi:carboxyl-terminal processing protease
MRKKIRNLMPLAAIILLVSAFLGVVPESFSAPLPVPIGSSRSVESSAFARAFELIQEGKFDAAGDLIEPTRSQHPARTSATAALLAEIIDQYKDIDQRRQASRETSYAEAIADLEKLQSQGAAGDANDRADADDVNDITEVLSVIARVREYADQKQREQLMSDSFVRETVHEAIDEAAESEVAGKWLDAYTNCYYWLGAIDPNNEGYSDYAQHLLDKATLAMAFEDSPCETSDERFAGVEKEMFTRSITFLDSHYVTLLDYEEMATDALKRCKLLAEVVGTSSRFGGDSADQVNVDGLVSEGMRDPKKLAGWSSTLDELADQVRAESNGLTGLSRKKFLQIFDRVLRLNELTVGLPQPVLISQFAEASLSALDPYTVVIWPKQIQDFEQMMTNEFMGIGIEISKRKGELTVSSLLLDTPAFHSALDAGDVIEAVDGLETKDMSLACAAKKIKGRAGTSVNLTVRRSSENQDVEDKVFDIRITRDRITVPTVRGWQRTRAGKWLYMIDENNKIGFVRLTSFSADTADGLEKVLRELESEGLRGLILDLRWNTGGLLDSAVDVADKFIDEEKGLIVKRRPGFGRPPTFDYELSNRRGTHENYPLVILINHSSASASEIVAGALADEKYERATLVGTRTHGKGSVQGITGYPRNRAQLKYTMAYYHLPSGQRVESQKDAEKQNRKDWGVGPDVEVKLRSDELRKMFEVQRNNDVLVRADHDDADKNVKKPTVEETLAADPQLAVGLLIVRSKLLQVQTLARLDN